MGQIEIVVSQDPVDLNTMATWVPAREHGAINSFAGVVRSRNLGKDVVAIEYDCYFPLCYKVFSEIAKEAQEKFDPAANVFIQHRHGRLNVGEASVLIIATSGHRDESYRITRYVIEEIKVRAPIWKKEFYLDGETDWVRGHALCQHRKVDHHEHHRNHSCGGEVHSHGAR